MSKWLPFSFIYNRGNSNVERVGDKSRSCPKIPGEKEMWVGALWCNSQLFCLQSSARSLRTFSRSRRVQLHSSMRDWLFGLPGWIISEQSPWCQRKRWAYSWLCSSPVSSFRWLWTFRVRLMLSSSNDCLNNAKVFVSLFRDLHKIWWTLAVTLSFGGFSPHN
jgi:hypothetical protein